MGDRLTIGQVAQLTGVTRDTIRYYERLGLLPRPARTPAGYRQFPATAVNRLALVRNAQRFGFTLREIAGFLRVRDSGGKPCRDVRAAAQRRLDDVEQQIAELVAMRDRMSHTLQTWDLTLARTPTDRPARLLETLT
ncbi:MAG TPA: heavy metal-responsive transcriptional regulator [Vicinamibacterales bacterium]|jgi:DNA-binding transcriptional MerR regulator|nr:heavy metal-responsive transcriptional regulator [Vicinamibacterales bacterium]